MGRITADTYSNATGGSVVVNNLNIVQDATKDVTNVLFADQSFADNVSYNGSNEYLSPVYKYTVTYKTDVSGDDGYFQFVRGGGASSNSFEAFNSAATTPIAATSGAKGVLNETFQYIYEHVDGFTQLPANERFAKIHDNEYALSSDFNSNLGSFNYDDDNKGAWVRPFATFESVPLRNGPTLDGITYGTLIGYDGDFVHMKHGWHRLGTSYVGYNGAQINYPGTSTTLNGGLIGLTETFYKGNFWSAWTISAGANAGESDTIYGKDHFASIMSGLGTKTGYNFEFKEGRYILQPIFNMNYTFVNTFDYTTASGVRMHVDPNNSIQFHPMIRFIANYKNGWQPYARVGIVWSTMSETHATANGLKLPETSTKPYVEYGLGIQKQFQDKFTAFLQAMVRNGGRNGIAMTAGFRWALGKDDFKFNKLHKSNNVNKSGEIKSTKNGGFLQKVKNSLTFKKSNTESNQKKVLKQISSAK